MIRPTVGRVVWYYDSHHAERTSAQPKAATIAHVISDELINIGYLDEGGNHENQMRVKLFQGEGERPTANFCEWMPYQIGQAKKAE